MVSEILPSFPEDVPTYPLVAVDFLKLQAGDRVEQDLLWSACTTIGFFYLRNFGIDVDPVWKVGKQILELPLEEKLKYESTGEANRTPRFKAAGAAIVDEKGNPDTIEFFNVYKDDALKYPDIDEEKFPGPLGDGMIHVKQFVEQSEVVCRTIMGIFENYLELSPGSLLEKHMYDLESFSECRILRNPGNKDPKKVSLVPHTDFGSLSMVHHQRIGGLQVFDEQEWKFVKPIDGHVICNIGDALAVFSGGILHSSMHRVIPPPGEQNKHVRWSLVYFARPNSIAIMKPFTESPVVARAIEENPIAEIPPNTTNGDWVKRRVLSLLKQNYSGTESWNGTRGTEPNKAY